VSSGIVKDQVVTFHYTLRDKDGNVLDQSVGGDPLAYLHGHHNIIPGLEVHLTQKKVGEKLQVHVTPENGYGTYDPDKCFLIERAQLPKVDLQPGMALELHADDGETLLASVVAVDDKSVEVDANHPMAGKDLFFEVEIMDIRAASQEEITHGHVHGPGGHHH
jgi:FKBP-type peptidyl-prolyl cis-trans isomerase SlyD